MRLEGTEKRILKVCRLSGPEPRKCVLVADKKRILKAFKFSGPDPPKCIFSASFAKTLACGRPSGRESFQREPRHLNFAQPPYGKN